MIKNKNKQHLWSFLMFILFSFVLQLHFDKILGPNNLNDNILLGDIHFLNYVIFW